MVTETVQHFLDVQAKQLDWYCDGLCPAAAAELRRRIKERTKHYPRTDMMIEAAYCEIPRGGDIEAEKARIMATLLSIDPITLLDMNDHQITAALNQPVAKSLPNIPVHIIMAHQKMKAYMSKAQWQLVKDLMQGEEGEYFQHKMIELAAIIDAMPSYGKGDGIARLHYFHGGAGNWYLTELDRAESSEGRVLAFGHCDPFGDPTCAEWGSVSISEMVASGTELDFHWKPKPVSEILKGNSDEVAGEQEIRLIEGSQP